MEEQNEGAVEVVAEKKKITQRWWFWVIIVLCGVMVLSIVFDESASNDLDSGSTGIKDIKDSSSTQMDEQTYKSQCMRYTYDELARNPDTYKNKSVVFTGKVIQVMEDGNDVVLRVNVTKSESGLSSDTVYVTYKRKGAEGRILEDDLITFYGAFRGLKTYTTIFNSTMTIPHVDAKYIDQN